MSGLSEEPLGTKEEHMRQIRTPVYEEWSHEMVPATGHGPDIWYRIFWGTVNWGQEPDGMKRAIVTFMQYGQTRNWQLAAARGEIAFDLTPHIVETDWEAYKLGLSIIEDLHRKQVRSPNAPDKVVIPKVGGKLTCPYCRGEYNKTHYQVPIKAGKERKFLHDAIGAKDLDGPGSVICSNQETWGAVESSEHFRLRGDVLERQGGIEGPTVIGRHPKPGFGEPWTTEALAARVLPAKEGCHHYVLCFSPKTPHSDFVRAMGEKFPSIVITGTQISTDLVLRDVPDKVLIKVKELAGPSTKFFQDFKTEPMGA
jgi:hypothetical protein